MEKNKLQRILMIEGAFCVVISAGLYFTANIKVGIQLLDLPFEAMAWGLRRLSLSSDLGNFIACILYGVICMLPIIFLLIKYRKSKKISLLQEDQYNNNTILKADIILPLLSVYLFYMIYAFINPGTLISILPDPMKHGDFGTGLPLIKTFFSIVFYSLLISYIILVILSNFQNKDPWKRTFQALKVCAFLYVAYVCYALPFGIYSYLSFESLNTVNGMLTILKFGLELIPLFVFLGIIMAGIELVKIMRDDRYDREAAEAANKLAWASKRAVIVTIVCNILENLIQVIFSSYLFDTKYHMEIPFLPLILAFAGLIIAEHLKASALLYEDNQKII